MFKPEYGHTIYQPLMFASLTLRNFIRGKIKFSTGHELPTNIKPINLNRQLFWKYFTNAYVFKLENCLNFIIII